MGRYLERLLFAAVITILVMRAYLQATGFPQVGGGGLHIAHMLWGGLLMLLANVLLLGYVGRAVRSLAAIVAGVGFGLFIDEVGKFVTSDNDYFYQPAIAIMYVIFVALFLIFRALARNRSLSDTEKLANVLLTARDIVVGHYRQADARDGVESLKTLPQSRLSVPATLLQGLREVLADAERRLTESPGLVDRAATSGHRVHDSVVGWRWVQRAVIGFFVLEALLTVVITAFALANAGTASIAEWWQEGTRSAASTGHLLASSISILLVVVGVVLLPRSRAACYRLLFASVLISIFFIQVFDFYENQLGALTGVAVDAVQLGALSALLAAERSSHHHDGNVPPQLSPDQRREELGAAN